MTNQEMQDREDKWAELINQVVAGEITITDANDLFDSWLSKIDGVPR